MSGAHNERILAVSRAHGYEADSHGRVYERQDGEVWPTGMVVYAWASRNDITQQEFDAQREFQRNVRRV